MNVSLRARAWMEGGKTRRILKSVKYCIGEVSARHTRIRLGVDGEIQAANTVKQEEPEYSEYMSCKFGGFHTRIVCIVMAIVKTGNEPTAAVLSVV